MKGKGVLGDEGRAEGRWEMIGEEGKRGRGEVGGRGKTYLDGHHVGRSFIFQSPLAVYEEMIQLYKNT